jgi:hypothetical protein
MSDLGDPSLENNEVSDKTAVYQSVVLGPLIDRELGAGRCEGFYIRRQLIMGIRIVRLCDGIGEGVGFSASVPQEKLKFGRSRVPTACKTCVSLIALCGPG